MADGAGALHLEEPAGSAIREGRREAMSTTITPATWEENGGFFLAYDPLAEDERRALES